MVEVADRIQLGGLAVARDLHDFVADELLPAAGIDAATFWGGLERLVAEFGPRNRALLAVRADLQERLDEWHRAHPGSPDPEVYTAFLREIGYLEPEPADFAIGTAGVDPEIAEVAGPQLVVPVLNARYAINAVNARWGSLYDALYGSDAIPEDDGATRDGAYNPVRGARVVAYVRAFLDQAAPLERGRHADVRRYTVTDGRLVAELGDGTRTGLVDPAQLRGYRGAVEAPDAVLLEHHGLHVEIVVDPQHPVGAADLAGVRDVVVEAAITTIVDLEDSVAAVDAEDKAAAYRNWLGLNRGDLTAQMSKGERRFVRELADDRRYTAPDGGEVVLPGRSVMYVRNVGHLMTTDAVLDPTGAEIGEGILDALVTAAAARPGLAADNARRNSRTGSIYVVKPKMHGPAEVALTVDLFAAVEGVLGLPANTIKLGLMDEERRMSANLKAAIHAARERIVFINTGFLDRSGDEIHTAMEAGPIVRKAELKAQRWISTYEDRNVEIGLAAGLPGRAQIGKGMWAMPDLMADMLDQKIGHPRAGASTAWVPSPTAATLHALHYHQVDVRARQRELAQRRTDLAGLLEIPLADARGWTPEQVREELDTNTQSILGYVVRWIDQGVGCSKVPDYHDVALMEDRATLRISSQLLANWLRHGVITEDEVRASFRSMATVVDSQNADDAQYRPMSTDPQTNVALRAATELVLDGAAQPSGYTEPILHRYRRLVKGSA